MGIEKLVKGVVIGFSALALGAFAYAWGIDDREYAQSSEFRSYIARAATDCRLLDVQASLVAAAQQDEKMIARLKSKDWCAYKKVPSEAWKYHRDVIELSDYVAPYKGEPR